VKVLHRVRSSDPLWPRAMRRRPAMAWRSVSRGAYRHSIELRNHPSGTPTLYNDGEGNMDRRDTRVSGQLPGVRDLWHVRTLHVRKPGELGSG